MYPSHQVLTNLKARHAEGYCRRERGAESCTQESDNVKVHCPRFARSGCDTPCHTADRVYRCAKPHAVGSGRSHPHYGSDTGAHSHTYTHPHHGSDTGAHSHTYTYAHHGSDTGAHSHTYTYAHHGPDKHAHSHTYTYAHHGPDKHAHSHAYTYAHAYTYTHAYTYAYTYTHARGSDDHPFGVGASCARFMRRWILRYPRAGHRPVGRQQISLVEVRLCRNRLRAERRGLGYEARRRVSA